MVDTRGICKLSPSCSPWEALRPGSGTPTQPYSSSEEPGAGGCDLRSCYWHPPQTHSISQSGSDLPGKRLVFSHFQKSGCYGNENGLHF